MPRRGSLLKEFLLDALLIKKYAYLFWVIEVENIFALNCIHKNSKDWSCNDNKIYEDWVKIKTGSLSKRKSSDPRQRLRAAMNNKKNKCIKFIKQISTLKIYQFVENNHISSTGFDDSTSECARAGSPDSECSLYEYSSADSPGSDNSLSESDHAGTTCSVNEIEKTPYVQLVTMNQQTCCPAMNIEHTQIVEDHQLTYTVMEEPSPPDRKVSEELNTDQFMETNSFFDGRDIDTVMPSITQFDSSDQLQNDLLMNDTDFKKLCEEIGTDNLTDIDFQSEIVSEQPPVEMDIVPDQVKFGEDCEPRSQARSTSNPQLNIDLTLTNVTQVGNHVVFVGKINR